MRIKPILPDLYEISYGFVSAYLIKDSDELIMIDTGMSGGEDRLMKRLETWGLWRPGKRTHILLTQLHRDHTGGLNRLKKITDATVYAHELEADAIEEGVIMRPAVAAPTWQSRLALRLIGGTSRKKRITGTRVAVRLKGGEALGPSKDLLAVHTPGHTAGHLCFLWKRQGGVLFAGDGASGGDRPGYPMLFELPEQGKLSMERLGEMDFDKALFSHGKPILSGAAEAFRQVRW